MNVEPGDKYFSGTLDFGAAGEARVIILPNEKKESSKQPDHYIYTKKADDSLKRVGAVWNQVKKKESGSGTWS